jgi:hypothetical protein
MKAEINEKGSLIIIAENGTESFAIHEWSSININPCDGHFICKYPYEALILLPYWRRKITLFHRIWLKIQLFFYR